MKKNVLCVLALFFAVAFGVCAEEEGAFFSAEELIEAGLFKNQDEIASLSSSLSTMEKNLLYVEHKKDAVVPFCLNLFVGYGLGSFVQKDIVGGVIALSGDMLAGTLAVTGYLLATPVLEKYIKSGYAQDFDWTPYIGQLLGSSACMLAGGAVVTGITIFSCIRAFSYSSRYNGTLKSALSGEKVAASDAGKRTSLTVLPTFDISQNRPGLVASISF